MEQPHPVPTPAQRAAVVKANLDALPPNESALIAAAANKFFHHVAVGCSFGAIVGVAIPYRRAWLAQMVRTASKGGKEVFYPTLNGAAAEGAAAGRAAGEGGGSGFNMPLVAQGVLGGLAGAYLGGWLGGATGTMASARLIDREMGPGGAAKLKDTGLSIQRQLEELARTGQVPPLPTAAPSAAGLSSRSDGGDQFEEWSDEPEEKPVEGAVATGTPPSRWEELRKARAAPPSAWDTIRESSARASLPNSDGEQRLSPKDDEELRSSSGFPDDAASASDKEKRKREFEAMLDKERQGGDDAAVDKWSRSS